MTDKQKLKKLKQELSKTSKIHPRKIQTLKKQINELNGKIGVPIKKITHGNLFPSQHAEVTRRLKQSKLPLTSPGRARLKTKLENEIRERQLTPKQNRKMIDALKDTFLIPVKNRGNITRKEIGLYRVKRYKKGQTFYVYNVKAVFALKDPQGLMLIQSSDYHDIMMTNKNRLTKGKIKTYLLGIINEENETEFMYIPEGLEYILRKFTVINAYKYKLID